MSLLSVYVFTMSAIWSCNKHAVCICTKVADINRKVFESEKQNNNKKRKPLQAFEEKTLHDRVNYGYCGGRLFLCLLAFVNFLPEAQ